MPYKRRSGKWTAFVNIVKGIGIAVVLIMIIISIAAFLKSPPTKEKFSTKELPFQIAQTDVEEPDVNSEVGGKYYGLCRKNSIRTVKDFQKTVQKDDALTHHFAGFNWENARLGALGETTWTFVSYRNGENIRRTTKPVKLPKGDGYITDGVRTIRTYCCNDYVIAPPPLEISAAPAIPVEVAADPPRRMEKVVEEVAGPPRQQSYGSPSENSAGAVPVPETLSKVYYPGSPPPPNVPEPGTMYPGSTPSPNVPEPGTMYPESTPSPNVPEPGTMYLTGIGVAVIALLRLLLRK